MKYIKHKTVKNGWTDWIAPIMTKYRICCCDCGLVHDMEFISVQVMNAKEPYFKYKELPRSKYRILFRVKRNNRATAATRKHI